VNRRLLAVLALASSMPALGKPINYHCPKRVSFEATFTPDRAHVMLEGQRWTLARVRAAGEARYQDRAAGVSLVTARREAVLTVGPRELRCELYIKP
jgi:hypothetical protein